MEKILKIQSENGFSAEQVPSETAFTSNRLLDFVIPNNGTYDLGKSYISINMSVNNAVATGAAVTGFDASTDTAAYNTEISFEGDTANQNFYLSDNASMVRNCQMFSQNRGMVESIRRVDTLRQILWALENDKKEKQDGMYVMGTFNGRRGPENRTSRMNQTVIRNVNNLGVADSDPTTGRVSKSLSRDFKIPLSDLFGVGNALWNGNVYGETRIHLELNMNKLRLSFLGGFEDVNNGPAGQAYGAMANEPAVAQGTALTTLVTELSYKDYQLNFPFYVGQAVEINATDSVAGAIAAHRGIIQSIDYNSNNNANPPGGTERMTITMRNAWYTTPGAQGPANITNILVKALLADPAGSTIKVNRAEIILNEQVGVNGPSEIDYRTYTTDEQNASGAPNFFHQYDVEGNAQNLLIGHCANTEITPINPWDEYRLAIDNVDVTGNRSVVYNSNLQQDRILRFMNNRGQNISDIGLQSIITNAAQLAGANQVPMYFILETLPLKASSITVTFNLSYTVSVVDIVLYKELVKTI